MSQFVEGFGCRPIATTRRAPGPATASASYRAAICALAHRDQILIRT